MRSYEQIQNGWIAQGDCLQLMQEIPAQSVDMILADLPYGTTDVAWDTIIPFDKLWAEYNRVIKPAGAIVLTASGKFTFQLAQSNFKDFRYKITWKKNISTGFLNSKKMPLRATEDVLVFYKKLPTYNPQMSKGKPYKANVVNKQPLLYQGCSGTYQTDNKGTRYPTDMIEIPMERGFHPTQKPVALGEYLIQTYTNAGDTVLDNCFGSGSFLVAAQKTGRKFIGCELNQNPISTKGDIDYYEEAKKRLLAA